MAGHLRPGDVIGRRLRVLRTLGEGGYGSVYEAQALEGGPHVAVKVMHDRLGENEVAFKRFEREVGFVQRLRHPGVVTIHTWGLTDQQLPYIAFEMLEGRTLREEIDARGALGPWHAGEVARQVLEALGHAHRGGVVHRDIKPANVFLCGAGATDAPAVKILDFGVARSAVGGIPTLTATGQMVGTPHYMSPEQVRGLEADHRADLYSVGVVMAEMLSGQKLLQADTEIELLMIHVDEAPLALPPVVRATALSRIVARAVAKKPEQRYPDAEAMIADLRAAMVELGQSGAGHGPSWTISTARTALMERGPEPIGFRPISAPPPVGTPYAAAGGSVLPPVAPAIMGSGVGPRPTPPTPPPRRAIWPWMVAGLAAVLVLSVAVGLGVGRAMRGDPPVSASASASEEAERPVSIRDRHDALCRDIERRLRTAGYTIAEREVDGGGGIYRHTFTVEQGRVYHSVMVMTYQDEAHAKLVADNAKRGAAEMTLARRGHSVVVIVSQAADGGRLLAVVLP